MASVELTRSVEKVVGYPPLVEMDDRQCREFHEALLDAVGFEDLPGKVAGRPKRLSGTFVVLGLPRPLTADIARREAQALFERGYRGFDRQAMAESLIVSGPEECIRYLESMQRLGITHVLFRCAVQDQSKALQTIRLIGTEVIPHLRASSTQG